MTREQAFGILKSRQNVFLTGAAGSGKTYLLNRYIAHLREQGVPVAVTASTGIAATHIGGLTIHSWAGIGIKRAMRDEDLKAAAANRRVEKRFRKTEVLVIDEISMLDADRLGLVDRIARLSIGSKKPFGGLQIVFCGDFFQLSPVSAEKNEAARSILPQAPPQFAYRAASWDEANPRVCYLTERFRHDEQEFLSVLDAIRSAEVDDAVMRRLRSRIGVKLSVDRAAKLYSHNADVDAENMRELVRLPGREMKYGMKLKGVPEIAEALKRGCLAPEELVLKKDAAVMFVKNNFEEGYVNGTLGKIVGFDGAGWPVVATIGGKKIPAHPAKWNVEENGRVLAEISQVPLRLAWAITIHKSQGMTLDAAEIDLSDAFEKGMGYVALSRVRSLHGIRLLGLNDVALQVHPEILEFDAELRRRAEETAREFGGNEKYAEKQAGKTAAKSYSVEKIREKYHSAYQKWSGDEDTRLADDFRKGSP